MNKIKNNTLIYTTFVLSTIMEDTYKIYTSMFTIQVNSQNAAFANNQYDCHAVSKTKNTVVSLTHGANQ